MQTAHELFIHELNDMLDGEQKVLEALGEMAGESASPELRKNFEQHRQQTENQVERLREALDSIGEEPETTECRGIMGLKEEHDTFKEQDPSPDLMDVFNVGAGIKTERYEISAYESLIQLAKQMRHKQAEKLLNQNLKEEQQALRKLEQLSKKLKPEEPGMGEEEMEEAPRRGARGAARRGRRIA
ncbi:MAG TPA: DUF892 family protein [Terriglobales bacterium]|nr:DUF892 family protein [Terriglobales bacterium]